MACSTQLCLILSAGVCCIIILGNEVDCYPNQGEELAELKRSVEKDLQELKERLEKVEKRSTLELENKESTRQRRSPGNSESGNNTHGDFEPSTYFYGGQCFICPPGVPGPQGPPGPPGTTGRDGRDGRDWNGCGSGGHNGDEPPVRNGSSGGAVFVRWGRSECPSTSKLVYSGTAAGGHYSHKGSGSNYLCMPEDPIYDQPQAGAGGQSRALVYGAEYEMDTYGQWGNLHNNNVPCAVCVADHRSSMMMIPARNVCPGNWTREYFGYLVASYYNHDGRSEFVCMDKRPEVVPRSSYNANGALFYVAEGRCGSNGSGLPCGPYVDAYELTCAVCTR